LPVRKPIGNCHDEIASAALGACRSTVPHGFAGGTGLGLEVGRADDAHQPTLGVEKLSHLQSAKDRIGTLHAPTA
jgi:hypothetical protein